MPIVNEPELGGQTVLTDEFDIDPTDLIIPEAPTNIDKLLNDFQQRLQQTLRHLLGQQCLHNIKYNLLYLRESLPHGHHHPIAIPLPLPIQLHTIHLLEYRIQTEGRLLNILHNQLELQPMRVLRPDILRIVAVHQLLIGGLLLRGELQALVGADRTDFVELGGEEQEEQLALLGL